MKDELTTQYPLGAYITNLGKYNEGELCGRWHPFPTTKSAIQDTLRTIGIDGKRYEEFFITDYETNIDGLYDRLSEYANLDELNYLASSLAELSEHDIAKFEAALELWDYLRFPHELINLTHNLDCYDYLPDIHNDSDLGYYWIEESGCYDLTQMGSLANYIDYERFGRDIRLEEGGIYFSDGYIRHTGDSFHDVYDGITVPDEYRVFAFPDPPKRDRER